MSNVETPALDPANRLVSGPEIDRDLNITDRCRRKMIADGRLPPPTGYLGGRGVWRLSDYLTARERLLAAGRPRRPGEARKSVAA
jgi:hypothetical protein